LVCLLARLLANLRNVLVVITEARVFPVLFACQPTDFICAAPQLLLILELNLFLRCQIESIRVQEGVVHFGVGLGYRGAIVRTSAVWLLGCTLHHCFMQAIF
jgi:hypothetical protein